MLGEPPDLMSQAEADVWVFLHDFLHRDHNKDYRSLAACVLASLAPYALQILRMDAQGRVTQEAIVGREFAGDPRKVGWLLIHREHMRLLVPPEAPGPHPALPLDALGPDRKVAVGLQ